MIKKIFLVLKLLFLVWLIYPGVVLADDRCGPTMYCAGTWGATGGTDCAKECKWNVAGECKHTLVGPCGERDCNKDPGDPCITTFPVLGWGGDGGCVVEGIDCVLNLGYPGCCVEEEPTPEPTPEPPPTTPTPTSAPTPTPVPTGLIQGFKGIVSVASPPGFIKTFPVSTLTVSAPPYPATNANPYFFTNIDLSTLPDLINVSVGTVANYEAGYTLCYNSIDCHDFAGFIPGANAGVSKTLMKAGSSPFADLWWHFIPLPSCSIQRNPIELGSDIIWGQTAQFNSTVIVPKAAEVNVSAHVGIDWNVEPTISGSKRLAYSDCGQNKDTCTVQASFNPQDEGLKEGDYFYIYCAGYNDALHGCLPFMPRPHPADVDCGTNDYIFGQVIGVPDWWQVKNGDVVTPQSINTAIPETCVLPVCNPVFELSGDNGGFPGIPLYGTGLGIGPFAQISSTKWNAHTGTVNSQVYNYDYFFRKTTGVTFNSVTMDIKDNDLENGVPTNGYYWYLFTGTGDPRDVVTIGNIDLSAGRKVVLFVSDTEVVLNGTINLGSGSFFALFTGPKGIKVDGKVSGAAGQPALQGIYFTDGTFETGKWGLGVQKQLWIKGSVVALERINLQRKLQDISTIPSEFFEFSPDQIVLFPPLLYEKRMKEREVAP